MGRQVRYNVETMDENSTDQVSKVAASDTMHEAHPHASKRVVLGVTATIVVFVLGGIIWSRWGERIEEVCFGEDESCNIAPSEVYLAEPLEYDSEAFANDVE